MQQAYTYDNIGNRLTSYEGGNAVGTGLRQTSYATANNLLNQYTAITRVDRKNDFVGTSGSSDSVTVNGVATQRQDAWWRAEVTPGTSSPFAFATININGTPFQTIGSSEVPLRLPAYPSTTVPGYDADGNLTSDNRTFYVWDGENRLTETWSPNVNSGSSATLIHTTYTYDARGRRIAKNVNLWSQTPNGAGSWFYNETSISSEKDLYDGWNLAAIIGLAPGASGEGYLRSYLWGPDVSGTMRGAGGVGGLLLCMDHLTGQSHFPTYDGNGNVMALIHANPGTAATVDAVYEYDPFGRTLRANGIAAEGNPFRFSTKFTDEETGLVYYGFRYYSPVEGRWLGRDPLGEVGGVNLFTACDNNQLCYVDVLGREAFKFPEEKTIYPQAHRIETPKLSTIDEMAHSLGTRANQRELEELNKALKDNRSKNPNYKPPTKINSKEYGGILCQDECNGTITNNDSKTTGMNEKFIEFYKAPSCKEGSTLAAYWHTHGRDYTFDKNKNEYVLSDTGAAPFSNVRERGDMFVSEKNGVPVYETHQLRDSNNTSETGKYTPHAMGGPYIDTIR